MSGVEILGRVINVDHKKDYRPPRKDEEEEEKKGESTATAEVTISSIGGEERVAKVTEEESKKSKKEKKEKKKKEKEEKKEVRHCLVLRPAYIYLKIFSSAYIYTIHVNTHQRC